MLCFLSKKKFLNLKKQLKETKKELLDIYLYLNDLFSFLPIAVCDLNPLGVINNTNESFEKLTGYKQIEIVGERLEKIFLEKERVKEIQKRLLKSGKTETIQLTLLTKEKQKIAVKVSFAIRKDTEGNIIGFFVSIIDISSLKRIQEEAEQKIIQKEKELEESREALLNILEDTEEARQRAEEERKKTEAIIRNFVDGILVFKKAKELILINPKAEEFLKTKAEEVLGKDVQTLKRKNRRWAQLFKITGEEIKEVFRKEMAISKSFFLEITTSTVKLQEQEELVLVILHDISREKLVEQMKSQFVSIAAHQLRTPLSIIKWSLSLLREEKEFNKEEKDLVLKAYQTNERMINLVNDLLNVARIEEGRFVYEPKIVEFSEIVESVYNSLKEYAKQKKIEYSLEISEGKKIVKVDVEKISLAVKNLIENALKYTPEKGKVEVSVKERKRKHELVFSVKDTGVGIPEDQQERIFTKFFRGANVVRMQTEGSGLGLFITKNIIEAHGGKIWFKSQENKGTTFYFTLPLVF